MHDGQNDQRFDLHDDALLECLRGKLSQERQITTEVLRLMAEVDRRRLYAQSACDSMFAFATRVLGMSEAAAYKRIQVARAGRRFPTLFASPLINRPAGKLDTAVGHHPDVVIEIPVAREQIHLGHGP